MMNADDAMKIADLARSQAVSRSTLEEALSVLAMNVRQLRLVHRSNHSIIEYWQRATRDARAACVPPQDEVG